MSHPELRGRGDAPASTNTFLANLGKQFRELFDIKQISVDTLAEMGHEALESIGVSAFESVHMLIRGIAEIQSGTRYNSRFPYTRNDQTTISYRQHRTCTGLDERRSAIRSTITPATSGNHS